MEYIYTPVVPRYLCDLNEGLIYYGVNNNYNYNNNNNNNNKYYDFFGNMGVHPTNY
ncbi:MAG: hypothetical protein ACTSUE_05980 [Promethearchaeota archaeon]